MTVTTKSGTTYDLGADADELVAAASLANKQDLIEPLLKKMYEIGVKETMKKYNIEDKEEQKEEQQWKQK